MSRKAFTGKRPRWKSCCTPSRRISPRAWTHPATRMKARGDQGIMFGYACRETPALMPAPLFLQPAKILKLLAERASWRQGADPCSPTPKAGADAALCERHSGGSHPDRAFRTSTPLRMIQTSADIRKIVEPYIGQALPCKWINKNTVWHISPTGSFVIGGPDGDCGLTGRWIIVDAYGGAAPHGDGGFSSRTPPRWIARLPIAARYLAKNVVAAGLADRCTIRASLCHRRRPKPLSVYVDTHGTSKEDGQPSWRRFCTQLMNLKPARHPQASEPQQADLSPADLGLWPFRATRAR